MLHYVDDRRLVRAIGELLTGVVRRQRPDLVNVESGAEGTVLADVEVPHTDLQNAFDTDFRKIRSVFYVAHLGVRKTRPPERTYPRTTRKTPQKK